MPVSLRGYDRSWLRPDLIAGVTLAAVAIPEVMGYTSIAQTPVVTGLYTIVFPTVLFALLGASRLLVVGADSATAAILSAGLASVAIAGATPGSKEWVALSSLVALVTGVLLAVARGGPARVPRRLPVSVGAHRLPDRRRDPGGQRPDPRPCSACLPATGTGSRSSSTGSSSSATSAGRRSPSRSGRCVIVFGFKRVRPRLPRFGARGGRVDHRVRGDGRRPARRDRGRGGAGRVPADRDARPA